MAVKRKNFQELGLIPPSLIVPTTGNYYFVSSGTGNSGANGRHPEAAVATLAQALDLCTASKGDVIYLMPGHAENVGSAAAIACDVAGVSIVGLGEGGLRPKFSFTAADATFTVTAANITFKNIHWQANFLDVAIGLDVSGVDDITWEDCWFTDAASNLNFIITIDLATGADNITVRNCKFIGIDAQNDTFINGVAHNGLFIYDSFFSMPVAQAAACGQIATSGNATNVEIKRCSFVSNVDGALQIDFNGSANSGVIAECYFSSADGAGAITTGIDATGCHVFECYFAGEADSFGLVGGGTVYNNS